PGISGRNRRPQGMREDGFLGARMRGHRVAGGNDGIAARPHRSEEADHAIIIRLRPAIERMVVALGAAEADAEEDLRNGTGHFAGPGHDLVKVRRADLARRPLGGNEFAGEAVEGPVRLYGVANPAVVAVGALVAEGRP